MVWWGPWRSMVPWVGPLSIIVLARVRPCSALLPRTLVSRISELGEIVSLQKSRSAKGVSRHCHRDPTCQVYTVLGLNLTRDLTGDHTSYLSRAPRIYSCKFFLAGVNFFRFNAKIWQFTVYFAVITQKIGNLLCILP